MYKFKNKLMLTILATASLFGIGLASQNYTNAARIHYYNRYVTGKYNFYHNVPGRRSSYLMHYGKNYRNDRVQTYGSYWKRNYHYTKVNRYRRFFGFMNTRGLSVRPIRIHARKYRIRRYKLMKRFHKNTIRRYRSHRSSKHNKDSIPNYARKYIVPNYKSLDSREGNYPNAMFNNDGAMMTWDQIKEGAKGSNITPYKYLKEYIATTPKPSKYWNTEGEPTKLALGLAEKDVISDLNNDRESQGINSLTQDSGLQKIANIRANQQDSPNYQYYHGTDPDYEYGNTGGNQHLDPNGNGWLDDLANKYGVNLGDASGENLGQAMVTSLFKKPSAIARYENSDWDSGHEANRMSSDYTRVGIGISKNGSVAEDFGGSTD